MTFNQRYKLFTISDKRFNLNLSRLPQIGGTVRKKIINLANKLILSRKIRAQKFAPDH